MAYRPLVAKSTPRKFGVTRGWLAPTEGRFANPERRWGGRRGVPPLANREAEWVLVTGCDSSGRGSSERVGRWTGADGA